MRYLLAGRFSTRLIGVGKIPDKYWVCSFHFSLGMCNILRCCLVLLIIQAFVSASGVTDKDPGIKELQGPLKALKKPTMLSRIAKLINLNFIHFKMNWDPS
jgi:hypothetical protein